MYILGRYISQKDVCLVAEQNRSGDSRTIKVEKERPSLRARDLQAVIFVLHHSIPCNAALRAFGGPQEKATQVHN